MKHQWGVLAMWLALSAVMLSLLVLPWSQARAQTEAKTPSDGDLRSRLDKMLPDMGQDLYTGQSAEPAKLQAHGALPFASAAVAKNPDAPDAKAVGQKTCVACHALESLQFSHTTHARALSAAAPDPAAAANTCEACHGPGSEHAKHPDQGGLIIAYTHGAKTSARTQTETCLACHTGGARDHWLGSVHQANGLSCSDCHNPMARLSPDGQLANKTISDTCANCHSDIRAQFNRRSHMPLPEGQMACTDCHNPHGSVTKPLLKTDTVNETCYTCHAEKRGPFLFEHAPVRESCLNCHNPHGSNQQTLLIAPMPFLCQQCHVNSRHPNDLQSTVTMATGAHPDERLMGRSCVTCHAQVHGSNAPSGPFLHE